MTVLPPGNILQYLYVTERLNQSGFKTFLEVGSGNGFLSKELLNLGMKGAGCDPNTEACKNNDELNANEIEKGNYEVYNTELQNLALDKKFDVVISAMVIEHLDEQTLNEFISTCKNYLNPNGRLVFMVPASMSHWGIEDEIAGHVKRYEFRDFKEFEPRYGLEVKNLAGLNYPLSNLLLKLSNILVKRAEASKLALTQEQKTIESGNRDVYLKTKFPPILGLFLNKWVLLPWHWLQKVFTKHPKSLVIYCELGIKR